MYTNPRQFNREPEQHHEQSFGNIKKPVVKRKPCSACGGSGLHPDHKPKGHEQLEFPGMPKPRQIKPEDKHPDYARAPQKNKHYDYPKSTPNKKDRDYLRKRRNDDDDDKGTGGSSVPRKPKPKPKGPGEYRPIERKTDPDYARKLDRYRVQAR